MKAWHDDRNIKKRINLIIPLYRHSRMEQKVMSIRLSVYPEIVQTNAFVYIFNDRIT